MVLAINNLTGFGGGSQYASPMQLQYLQTATSSTNTTSYTFSSQNFGPPSSNRYIVIVVMNTFPTTAQVSTTSITIGGVTPTLIGREDLDSTTNDGEVRIYYAAVPTGSTGDIVINYGATVDAVAVAAYALYSDPFFVYDSWGDENFHPMTFRKESVAGGVIISGGISNTTTNGMTLTGLTEDVDAEWSTENRNYIAGSLSSPSASTYLEVGLSNAGSATEQVLCGVSLYQAEKCTAVPIIDWGGGDGDATNGLLTYTFLGEDIGDSTRVMQDRIVVVAAAMSGVSGGISACTINGNAATLINRTDCTATITQGMSTFYLNVPTGTTADIVITVSAATATRVAINMCYVLGSTGVPVTSSTVNGNNVTSVDVSLTLSRPCAVVGFAWNVDAATLTSTSTSISSGPRVESTDLFGFRSVLKTTSFTETLAFDLGDVVTTFIAWEGN
jgi:hypothetical protein